MELRHLRYFVAVADELHFGRAAERLGVSQPPLSQQVRALEEELGVRLFDRTSRKVALTEPGRLFLAEARLTLSHADHAVDIAKRAGRGDLGRLAIGFNPSAPFIPEVARAMFDFRQRFPEIDIELSDLAPGAQIPALARGDIDLGFLRSPTAPILPDGMCATRILEERMQVAMRPDHRWASKATLSFRDLDGEGLISYARAQSDSFHGRMLEMLQLTGVAPVVVQDVADISTLFGLVAAGLGVTVLAQSLCALQPANITFRPLRGKQALSSMWVLRARHPTALAARQFLEILDA
jgi:DNA-binding transcriptional LysR family regulator